jgi:NAD(P)-dependent dehydrogenase (short-subunit alcohol dehydrogenase family)
MSVAHRFGAAGYRVGLISRSDKRHPDYLGSLRDAGIEAVAFTADAAERHSLRHAVEAVRTQFGRVDVGYYGPAAMMSLAEGIATLDGPAAEEALRGVVPAVDFASQLIPELTERGSGGLLFAGGLSSVVPMPALGGLALASAALRNYAITLHAALAPAGVYAGTITIGGLIERGDIHQAMTQGQTSLGDVRAGTLDPDELAETLWQLYLDGTEPEAVINALAG